MIPTTESRRAEEQVARTITVVIAAAALLLGTISLGPIIGGTAYLAPWYTPLALWVVFGGYGVLLVTVFLVPLRGIRIAHGVYAIAFLVAQLALIFAVGTESLPTQLPPWVLEMPAIGTACAALAWRPSLAWGYLLATSVLEAPLRWIAHGLDDWDIGVKYALLTVILAGLFTALAIAAMRNAAAVDAATQTLREAAARSAAATARAQEQARLDALVHDEVMNTLYYASRDDPRLEESVRRQARAALDELEVLRGGREEAPTGVRVDEFVSRLRSVVLEASIDARFESSFERVRDVPSYVAAAFAEATSEAVRNSLSHAPDSTLSVVVTARDRGIAVRVSDDGPGFEASDVAPHRLGIAVSIRGRMAAVPGGSSRVESSRGRGTLVVLEWSDS